MMMTVHLKDWNSVRRYWDLDISSGSAQPSGKGVSHGFLAVIRTRVGDTSVAHIAAVYADHGKLWFQVDGRRWEIESIDFQQKIDAGGGMSQFKILSQGEVVADIVYLGPTADPVLMLDPTFDELDMEIQDIFYFMSVKGTDPVWRAAVLLNWEKGMEGPDLFSESDFAGIWTGTDQRRTPESSLGSSASSLGRSR
jgi:hypothetical protein